jgi:hypothetical protein
MQWFVAPDKTGVDELKSPEWEVLKTHFSTRMIDMEDENASNAMIWVSGSLSDCKRFLDKNLSQEGKDALDIILIKTRMISAPWEPTFPVKAFKSGFKTDFNKLDLKALAPWFPQSKVYNSKSSIPDSVKSLLN